MLGVCVYVCVCVCVWGGGGGGGGGAVVHMSWISNFHFTFFTSGCDTSFLNSHFHYTLVIFAYVWNVCISIYN